MAVWLQEQTDPRVLKRGCQAKKEEIENLVWDIKTDAEDLFNKEITDLDNQHVEDIAEFERRMPEGPDFQGELAKCQLIFQTDYERTVKSQQKPINKEK